MTYIEVLKQALEALEKVKASADEWQERTGKEIKGWMQPVNDSITSLRQVMAEAEKCKYGQEPKSCTRSPMDCQCALDACFAEAEKQEPVSWKLVPVKPTEEMLKAMDECSTEGYDERLYSGHAASVYMAAVDAAPYLPQRQPLTDEQKYALIEKHLGLKKRRHATVIDPWTGRYTDAQRYFDLIDEAAHGIKEKA